MDELTGLSATFPPDELNIPRTTLAIRAAHVCALAEGLLHDMGHTWEAYNFQQDSDTGVVFSVKYPGADGARWVTTGALQFDGGSDTALAQVLAAYWDREFRGVNPPKLWKGLGDR